MARPWTIWGEDWVSPDDRAQVQSLYGLFWLLGAGGLLLVVAGILIEAGMDASAPLSPGASAAFGFGGMAFLGSSFVYLRFRTALQNLLDGRHIV